MTDYLSYTEPLPSIVFVAYDLAKQNDVSVDDWMGLVESRSFTIDELRYVAGFLLSLRDINDNHAKFEQLIVRHPLTLEGALLDAVASCPPDLCKDLVGRLPFPKAVSVLSWHHHALNIIRKDNAWLLQKYVSYAGLTRRQGRFLWEQAVVYGARDCFAWLWNVQSPPSFLLGWLFVWQSPLIQQWRGDGRSSSIRSWAKHLHVWNMNRFIAYHRRVRSLSCDLHDFARQEQSHMLLMRQQDDAKAWLSEHVLPITAPRLRHELAKKGYLDPAWQERALLRRVCSSSKTVVTRKM